MTIQEKARLLFDDHALRTRTRGKERVLTSEEEDTIIKDCREKRQINELNRLGSCNVATGLALSMLFSSTLQFELTVAHLGSLVVSMTLKSQAKDTLYELMDLLARKAPELMMEAGELHNLKYEEEKKFEIFEDFNENPDVFQPNRLIQRAFTSVFNAYKSLKQGLYILEFIEKTGGMSFIVREGDQEVVDDAQAALVRFEKMDGWLQIMEVFRKCYENKLMEGVIFESLVFQKLMLDPAPILELSQQEKEEAEEIISWHIKNI